jgi:hypothetical protein
MANTPSYSNTGGKGDRTASIAVTTNLGYSGGGNISRLVSGSFANNLYFNGEVVNATKYLRFDFGAGAKKLITECIFYEAPVLNQGTWKWRGSDDGTNWTDLTGSFVLGVDGYIESRSAAMLELLSDLSTNVDGYRYYELCGVSGSTSGGPWVYFFDFKIDDWVTPGPFTGYTYGDEDPAQVLTTATSPGTYTPIADSDTVDGGISYGAGEEGTGVNATTLLSALGLAVGNLDTQLAALPTAAENADAVFDETLGAHTGALKTIYDGVLSNNDMLSSLAEYDDLGAYFTFATSAFDHINSALGFDPLNQQDTLPVRLNAISGYVDCLPATWVTVPTAAAVADAVLNEAVTDHTGWLTTLATASAVDAVPTTTELTAALSGLATEANVTAVGNAVVAVLARLGSWTGTGLNTVLGAFRAVFAKATALMPSDVSTGTTADNTTDSLEAIRDRGDAAYGGVTNVTQVSVSSTTVGAAPRVDIERRQYEAFGALTIEAGSSQAGKSHSMVFFAPGSTTAVWRYSTATGEISASGTAVTITATDTRLTGSGTWAYVLENTTDDLVICEGILTVKPNPDPKAT